MQISPSASLFQALSSISQPQGVQIRGTEEAQPTRQASPAVEPETPQAVRETRQAESSPETADAGTLLDVSA